MAVNRIRFVLNRRIRKWLRCGSIIKSAFLSIANRIITNQKCLDRIPKKEPVVNNFEYIKLDKKIKELEAEGQYSSKELPALIFERAKTLYRTSRVDDTAYNTEKMKQAFAGRPPLHGFDEELFQTVIRQFTVHKDEKLTFEFINGLTLEAKY